MENTPLPEENSSPQGQLRGKWVGTQGRGKQGLLKSNNHNPVAEFKARFLEAGRFFVGVGKLFVKASGYDLKALNLEEAQVVYRMAGARRGSTTSHSQRRRQIANNHGCEVRPGPGYFKR